jgi:hypothetical protein
VIIFYYILLTAIFRRFRLALEYQTTYLSHCIYSHTDKACMAHSLEARAPFFDRELMAYMSGLPLSWKLRRGKANGWSADISLGAWGREWPGSASRALPCRWHSPPTAVRAAGA